ncbi:MAG: hypothetical protein ACLUVC_02220 [Longibaculum sp.]
MENKKTRTKKDRKRHTHEYNPFSEELTNDIYNLVYNKLDRLLKNEYPLEERGVYMKITKDLNDELIKRAKNNEKIINNDEDYYTSIGIIWYFVRKATPGPRNQGHMNLVMNAKRDVLLKNRFKQIKIREKPYHLYGNWKGKMLDEILEYVPTEEMNNKNNYSSCILIGYMSEK